MFVRNNLPIAVLWKPSDASSTELLAKLFKCWPAESNAPLILVSEDFSHPENIPHPDGYLVEKLVEANLAEDERKILERGRVFLVNDTLHLGYFMDTAGRWVATKSPQCSNISASKSYECPASLIDYTHYLEGQGTILNCSTATGFSAFSVDRTPVFSGDRIMSLVDPKVYLSQQFGKARSLNDVVLSKANNLLESVTGMRLDWFHKGWQFEQLSHELSGSVDLLSCCDAYTKSQSLVAKLLESNRQNYLSVEQLDSIHTFVSQKLRESDKQIKLWLVGAGQLQLVQVIFAVLTINADSNQLRKQLRIYVTDSTDEQLSSLKFEGDNLEIGGNSLPEKMRSYYKDLGIADANDLITKTRILRQLLVVHSRLNPFSDPFYRNVDVIVCGGLLGGLTPEARTRFLQGFAASHNFSNLFVTAAKEAPEVVFSILDSGFVDDSIKGVFRSNGSSNKLNWQGPISTSAALRAEEHESTASERAAVFVVDDYGQIIESRGNVAAFIVTPDSSSSLLVSNSLFEVLYSTLGRAANDLFNNRSPLKTCKKMVIGEFDVMVLSIAKVAKLTQFKSDQIWQIEIESVEDIELDLSVDKILELDSEAASTRAMLTNVIAEGQLARQKSIRKLEDLNLELAEKNEQYSNETARFRLLNTEVSDSNVSLNKNLRIAHNKNEMLSNLFTSSQQSAALLNEQGGFEIINDAMASRLELNTSAIRYENLNIFKLESELPNKTLIKEFGAVLSEKSKKSFQTNLSGSTVEILLTPIDSALSGSHVLLEILELQTTKVEKTDLKPLFNKISMASVEIDRLGKIENVDSMIQSWLGKQDVSPIGRDLDAIIAPDYHSLHEAKWQELKTIGFADYEVALMSSDNRLVWCRIKAIQHPSKPDHSYLFLLENILEQQRTQQEILMSQKMESLGLLTGGIAHDFNNILAIILGYTDLLILKSLGKNETENTHLNHIRDAGKRAQHLIKQMLFYSRGDDHHDAQQHDVCKAVSNLLPLVRSSFPNDIQLSTEKEVENALVDIDPTHLDQILMNLCINARDAIESTSGREGEITIAVDAAGKSEEIRQCASCRSSFSTLQARGKEGKENHYIVVRVTDNGAGIDSEVIKHVFDPFFSTKEVGKGSGMGLSVIHGLVHQYGGHIEVFSSNYGVQFCIWLPASCRALQANLVDVNSPKELKLSPWRILLVEDDAVVAQVTEMILTNLGMTVTVKEDGVAASDYLAKTNSPIDLIVSDLSMPRMDGLGLANWCKCNGINVPILLLTGNDSDLDAKGLPSNVDSILNKPASMDVIGERLAKIQVKSSTPVNVLNLEAETA
ncbi:MAG: ATP-binding protein [Pseudohongiellaceae bacterium]